jgi:predicted DNA-binding transcriptional regulator AlpA
MKTLLTPTAGLKPASWCMAVLGYSAERRSAFWQFVYGNSIPYVRVGRRKIMFSEAAVNDWIAARSSGRAA